MKAENKYCIYKFTFPNSKIYIGQTKNFFKRMESHRYNSFNKNEKVYNIAIGRAIRKYGWENIVVDLIEENISINEIDNKEKYYIKKFKSNKKKFGYNLTTGGNKYKVVSKESVQKMINSLKGKCAGEKHPMFGKFGKLHHNSKTILQFSFDGQLIKEWFALMDVCRKLNISVGNLCLACKGDKKQTGGFIWIYKDNFNKKELRKKLKKLTMHAFEKPIYQIDNDTNKILKRWDSATKAGKELDINRSHICAVCRGSRKTAGGFGWKFKV